MTKNEPVMAGAAVLTVIITGCGLLVAFGVPISDDQVSAIVKFATAVIAVAPLVVGWVVRRRTVTVAKNAEQVERARAELPPGAVMLRGGQNPRDGR